MGLFEGFDFGFDIPEDEEEKEIVSGTTIMACEQNGRVAYAMELDPRYVDAAVKRWETFTGEKAVLVND